MIPELSPIFQSWADFLERTTYAQRMTRCYAAAKRANRVHACRWRKKVIGRDAWSVKMRELFAAPCGHCGSETGQECLGDHHLSRFDVWSIMEEAQGRCCYCGSLAVENKPHDPETGKAAPWASIGRRIGSLEHAAEYYDGRSNHPTNLRWSCLWCNTWPNERTAGALDHGGYFP